jgi:hypothetical protein
LQLPRIPTRRRTALLLVVVAATGCGGHGRQAEPRLPRGDAAQLVTLARQIERDAPTHGCAAKDEIASFAAKAHALVAAGRVPVRLRAPLLRGVEALLADTPACAPPAPAPVPASAPRPGPAHGKPPKDHPPKPHDHHGHGHDQGDEG